MVLTFCFFGLAATGVVGLCYVAGGLTRLPDGAHPAQTAVVGLLVVVLAVYVVGLVVLLGSVIAREGHCWLWKDNP